MKEATKIYMKIVAMLLIIAVFLTGAIYIKGAVELDKSQKNEGKIKVLTSFYPMYVIALNVAEGSSGVEVSNLTPSATGCLHDFQLSPEQVLALNAADAIVLNGGGAESFLTGALNNMPDLKKINSSKGIDFLELVGGHDHHDHDHDDHDDILENVHYNEHIWTGVSNYIKQVENVTEGLCELDPDNQSLYLKNRDTYLEKVKKLQSRMDALKPTSGRQIEVIIFHNSLTYFADYIGFEIIGSLSIGEETASAAELKELELAAENADNPLLLYDEQYPVMYSNIAAHGTSIVLDAAVNGSRNEDEIKDAWLNAMNSNCEKLENAIGEGE